MRRLFLVVFFTLSLMLLISPAFAHRAVQATQNYNARNSAYTSEYNSKTAANRTSYQSGQYGPPACCDPDEIDEAAASQGKAERTYVENEAKIRQEYNQKMVDSSIMYAEELQDEPTAAC